MSQTIPATLIPGDGIGPEIMDATLLAAGGAGRAFSVGHAKSPAWKACKPRAIRCRPQTLDSIKRTRLALKGPLETPSGGGYRSSNVRLREQFKLYANLRPARTLIPGGRFDNIDLVVVRENLEGLYIGHEHYIQIDDDPHAVAMATGVNTRQGSRRLLRIRLRARHCDRAQEGRDRAQGQHHEGLDREFFSRRDWSCTNASTRVDSSWRPSSSMPAP